MFWCRYLKNGNVTMSTGTTGTSRSIALRVLSSNGRISGGGGNTVGTILYLHVGPSGDCWTGPTIFAAKHLQPDYVKSIPLPAEDESMSVEGLLEFLEDNPKLAQEMYDTETLSKELLSKFAKERDQ